MLENQHLESDCGNYPVADLTGTKVFDTPTSIFLADENKALKIEVDKWKEAYNTTNEERKERIVELNNWLVNAQDTINENKALKERVKELETKIEFLEIDIEELNNKP